MDQTFLKPRLTGSRFDGHAIPLELLTDLAVLEEMIIEVAKLEFLKDNPGRKRAPRGFTKGIALKLTGIEAGSAIPIIGLFNETDKLFHSSQPYYERARDTLADTIDAAESNQSIMDLMPEKALLYFDRIGRSLHDGEAMEFTIPDRDRPARLTKDIRRRLLLASTRVKELTEEASVRGTIHEANQLHMTCEILLIDGRKISAPIAEQHRDTILEAFNGYKTGTHVQIQGIGRFNRNELLLGFESIEQITILDTLDIDSRLDEMRILRDGWLDGRGEAPPHAGLDWLSEVFDKNYPDKLPLPYLYPTPTGGVQAEWSLGKSEISLDIDLGTHIGRWHSLNVDTDEEDSSELNLENEGAWQMLAGKIQQVAEGEA
jgi:hypothetical protein